MNRATIGTGPTIAFCVFAFALWSAAGDLDASRNDESPGRLSGSDAAVIVGINRYDDARLRPLAAAVNDATGLRDLLVAPGRGEFSKETVRLLTDDGDSGYRPTRANILRHLLEANRDATGMLLVFIAGHGVEAQRSGYLLPSDARVDDLDRTALPLDLVIKTLAESEAKQCVFIVDACHSGTPPAVPETMGAFFARALFAESGGLAILSSCNYGEKSHEIVAQNHGAFTSFLLEGLKGGADSDGDLNVTLDEAYRFVWQKLQAWSRENRVKQLPRKIVNLTGDIVLTRCQQNQQTRIDRGVPPTLAVLPFTTSTNDSALKEQTSGIAESMTRELIGLRTYTVVERIQIDRLLQELNLSRDRLTDPRTAQQVGRILGAEWMLLGNVQSFGNQVRLFARRVRTETSQVVQGWEERGTVSAFLEAQDRLGQKVRRDLDKPGK